MASCNFTRAHRWVGVTDKLLLDAQPDVQIRIGAKPVRVGLDHGSQCRLFTQRGLIMGRGQMFYLVGATG